MDDSRRGARPPFRQTSAGMADPSGITRPDGGAEAFPFSHVLRVAELSARRPNDIRVTPDAAARAAIAEWLDAVAIPSLSLTGRLVPVGRRDWQLEARLQAKAEQQCVVTLEPVITRVDEPVERRYVEGLDQPEGEESEIPDDTSLEPLTPVIDLGAVMLEALELALPLYPRAAGAALDQVEATPPGAAALDEETRRPFAGLAELMAKRDGGS